MSYDKNKIFEQAKQVAIENELYFIEDIVAYLPISKPTFYDYFKVDSNELNEIKELIEHNKVLAKVYLRKKWKDAEAPVLQLALMKLISTDEELRKLSMKHTEHSGEIKTGIAIETMTTEELIQRANAIKSVNG